MGLSFLEPHQVLFPFQEGFQHTGKGVREFELDQVLLQDADPFLLSVLPLFLERAAEAIPSVGFFWAIV